MPGGWRGAWVAAGVLAAATGCSSGTFACLDDDSCAGGPPGGRCEASGFCSFPDEACASGYRYGEFAGSGLSNACVDDPVGTGSTTTGIDTTDPTLQPATTAGPPPTTTSLSTDTTTDASSSDTTDGATTEPPATTTDASTTGQPDDCPAGWWDCAWATRYPIELAALGLPAEVTDLPVPLRLDPSIAIDPSLRIVDAAGTVLPHERDDELLWIRVDAVPANAPVTLHAYVDNPFEDEPPGGSVWDDGFAAVWHLADALDASVNGVDGIPSSVTHEQGVLGSAAHFDGIDDLIEYGAPSSLNDLPADGFTIEAWLLPDATKEDSFRRIFDKTNDLAASAGPGLYFHGPSDTPRLQLEIGASGIEARYSSVQTNFDDWAHIAVRYEPGEGTRMWVGGAELNVSLLQPPLGEFGSDVGVVATVGARVGEPSASRRYAGLLDELRITRGLRTEAWIVASMRVADSKQVSVGLPQTQR